MPAYNFKKQFAPDVESGKKRQTIRKQRKRPTVPGDKLFLYTGMRTKQCRKLMDAVCKKVELFSVHKIDGEDAYHFLDFPFDVFVDERSFHPVDVQDLAIADGFDNTDEFIQFFANQYGLPFHGEIIHW